MTSSPAPPAASRDAGPRSADEVEIVDLDAHARPTHLTRGVLNALDRPAGGAIVPSYFGAVAAGLLTAGVWPAWSLPRKWLLLLRWNRNLVWHLAEWTQLNVGQEEAAPLRKLEAGRLPTWLAFAAMMLAAGAAGVVAFGLFNGHDAWSFWNPDPTRRGSAGVLGGVFLGLLLGSYGLTWVSVNLQLRRLRRLGKVVEQITSGMGPIPDRPPAGWILGIRPVSGTVAVVLALAGFFWALPMLIVTTAQRRAVLVQHRQQRRRVSGRIRQLLSQRRPPVRLPPAVDRVQTCRNKLCDQKLPHDARFCPRCGTAQKPISRVLE